MKLFQELSMSLCNQTGRIHSTESFGTVDGPGVRFVVFFQGCPMRCQYCHNPDTWEAHGGTEMTVQELLDQYENNRSFYKNGGMTATGGEPMLQLPFLTKLFKEAKNVASRPAWILPVSLTVKKKNRSLQNCLLILTLSCWTLNPVIQNCINHLLTVK